MHLPLTRDNLSATPGWPPLDRLRGAFLHFDALDSTNAYLLTHAERLPDGSVAIAEYQSAGRGRHRRPWSAPRGAAILLSVLLHEAADSPLVAGRPAAEGQNGAAPGATLLACVAACEAVEATTECRPAIRWPNDLHLRGRKLGGVLAEATRLVNGANAGRALVVGIGLNCLQHAGHFPEELRAIATSLEIESMQPIDRVAVARALLTRLDARLAALHSSSAAWDELHRAWRDRCEDLHQHVTLQCDGQTHSGTVVDIAPGGDLVVQLDHGGRMSFGAATTTRTR